MTDMHTPDAGQGREMRTHPVTLFDCRSDPRSDPALVEIVQRQWDAVALLTKAHVLDENAQAMKSNPLFWGDVPVPGHRMDPLGEFVQIWPPALEPRNDGVPVFVLNLSMAMDLKKVEALCCWMAAPLSGSRDGSDG